jgi:hypothetical protein
MPHNWQTKAWRTHNNYIEFRCSKCGSETSAIEIPDPDQKIAHHSIMVFESFRFLTCEEIQAITAAEEIHAS